MIDYRKYINALRKCAKEHENDNTSTGHIIVSDLCRDTANILESLEQEPCDDCISRDDLREPRFIIAENDYQKGWNDALNSVYENAPSIQPKTGHWIQEEVRGSLQNRCSICDRSIDTTYFYNYCPNCGARMTESEE